MYDWPELQRETDAFWQVLRARFRERGFEPARELRRSQHEDEGWLDETLLFSQTCGYPFATRLSGRVQLLNTPCYSVPGCEGARYSSAVVVRNDSALETIEEARSARFAFNSLNSLSGYRCLVSAIGRPVDFFSSVVASGGHRNSARMVAGGEADIAAMDAVCWSMFQRFEPRTAGKLRVLCWTEKLPGLPFITNGWFEAEELDVLRNAIDEASLTPEAEELAINGTEWLCEGDYLSKLSHLTG